MLIGFILVFCVISLALPTITTRNRKTLLAFYGAILLAPCVAVASGNTKIIGYAEADGFKIGMTKAQIDRTRKDVRYGEDINSGGECIIASVKNKPINLMLEKGVLTRIYFNDATYATPKNIHIGSTEKQALTAYGKAIKVEIHKYNQNGHYLTRLGRNGIVLRFETNGKLISGLSIGTISAIEYVEGCL